MPDFRGNFRVEWLGHEIAKKYGDAARAAVNAALDEAVAIAKDDAPVRTGKYKGSITHTPATRTARGWTGALTTGVPYDIWVEIGTSRMPGQHVLQKAMLKAAPHLASRIKQEAD
jgi:hypothetical protein